jgi:uncharacterized protein
MTSNVRVLAIDDAPFPHRRGARVLVVAVLARGPQQIEGVYSTQVVRDGWTATSAIAQLVLEHRLEKQAKYLMLDGIAVGGFNVVDLPALVAATGVPAIAVMRRAPDLAAIRQALERVTRGATRAATMARAGEIHVAPPLRFQCCGCAPEAARQVLAAMTVQGHYPEPLRVAHLIGAGVMLGRSRGGA